MAGPTTAAQALHDIFQDVHHRFAEGARTPYHAWQAVAGHDVPTREFAVFHAEVCTLVSETVEELRSLPPKTQSRYEQYVNAWWVAAVRPREDWANGQVRSLLQQHELDLLGALADAVSDRAELAGRPTPDDALPVKMHKAVTQLLTELAEDYTLPSTVKQQIIADLQHVLWLLDQVETFGVAHAVRAVERVSSRALGQSAVNPSRTVLKSVGVGLLALLAFGNAATGQTAEIATNLRTTFGVSAEGAAQTPESKAVNQTIVQVEQICDGAEPKQLPPGRSDRPTEPDDATPAAE